MTALDWDTLWIHATLARCEPAAAPLLTDAAIAIKNGQIAWIGPMHTLPGDPHTLASTIHNATGCCITPGLIDCHTHLVYAGNRVDEFEKHLQGARYADIAAEGGGILSTVRATREASEDDLFRQSMPRAAALQRSGITTLEIKSGYGLDWNTEEKILRVAEKIEQALSLTVKRTFLGAHTLPPEYRKNPQAYVDSICHDMIPKIAEKKCADAVDVFCETIAFNLTQTEQIFKAAKQHHLAVKCHGEQLSCSESTVLAARYHALSVDHLEYASKAGIQAMAASGSIAVLLPYAFYFLREKQRPPIEWLRELKVPIALATDCNPGTSPVLSILCVMNMACTLFQMTPKEVLQGVTLNAAAALGMHQTHGSLVVGKTADLAIWQVQTPAELCYSLGGQPLKTLVKSGKIIDLYTG